MNGIQARCCGPITSLLKKLSNMDTMDWHVLFYAYDSTAGNPYALSHSALKPIAGRGN